MKHSLQDKTAILILITGIILISACQSDQTTPRPMPTASTTPPTAGSPTQANTMIQSTPHNTCVPTQTPETMPQSKAHVTLMAVGDIMLGRTIGEMIKTEGISAPFLFTAETLSQADITVGNLECPISDRGSPEDKAYTFRAPLEASESLAYGGFDLVSLANNHILDYGPLALEDTLAALSTYNILWVGAGMDATQAYSPVFIEISGLRLAFLAFLDVPLTDYDYLEWDADSEKPGVAWAHNDEIRKNVQQAKSQADLVIVLMHNGYEITRKVYPSQQEVARLAIDSGAALVIGSHPHVLQDIEEYKGGLIVYSMGNFVFDNFLFPPNYSAILAVELSSDGIESYELIDVIVQLNGVPQIMEYDLDNAP